MPNLYELALAGLLHDVGKLGQRAFRGDEGLSEQSRRLEDQACIPARGYYSHRHVLYTAEFIDRYARNAAVDMVNWDNVLKP